MMAPSPAPVHPVTQRPIATGHVSHQGEIVAAVVAADRYGAEDAAGLVETRYEALPAVRRRLGGALGACADPASRGVPAT